MNDNLNNQANDFISSGIIAISISKILGKTSITFVSYNPDLSRFISNENFILVSKIEENGIYTHTYIEQTNEDLLKELERQKEEIEFDFYIRTLYEKIFKREKFFQYKREKIVGNQELLVLRDRLLSNNPQEANQSIKLTDIVEYPLSGKRVEITKYIDMEYKKNINVNSSDGCDSDTNKIKYKRTINRDYKINPKVNYKFCEPEEKCLTFKYNDDNKGFIEIQIIYETNRLCTIHRIKNVFIRKNVIKRYIYTQPLNNNNQNNQNNNILNNLLSFPNQLNCENT